MCCSVNGQLQNVHSVTKNRRDSGFNVSNNKSYHTCVEFDSSIWPHLNTHWLRRGFASWRWSNHCVHNLYTFRLTTSYASSFRMAGTVSRNVRSQLIATVATHTGRTFYVTGCTRANSINNCILLTSISREQRLMKGECVRFVTTLSVFNEPYHQLTSFLRLFVGLVWAVLKTWRK